MSFGFEQGVAAGLMGLGIGKGGSGVAQQFGGCRDRRETEGDPDRPSHHQLVPAPPQWLMHLLQQLLGDADRLGRVGDLFQEDRELVSGQAGNGIALARRPRQSLRHAPHHGVARRVTESLVDRFEPFEIETEERRRRALPLRPHQRVFQAIEEEGAVRQPGQRVVERLVGQLLFVALAVGHVVRVDDDAADTRLIEQIRRDRLEPSPRSIPVP